MRIKVKKLLLDGNDIFAKGLAHRRLFLFSIANFLGDEP